MNKCAVLCNGPSRVAYKPNDQYEFVLGCNAPWTTVDATVVLDKPMMDAWNKNRSLIDVPVYFSTQAWSLACELDESFYQQYKAGVIKTDPYHHSSGHNAVEIVLKKGFKQIDIYGCDAYFDVTNYDSYTRSVIPIDSPNKVLREVQKMNGWKLRWNDLIKNHPKVKFNFVRG